MFLAAVIFTTLFTGSVLAQNEPLLTLGTQEDLELTATIIEEDSSRRGEFEKHFLLSDGTYLAGTYDEPIHMLQGDKWIEIDNTLELVILDNGSEGCVTRNGLFDASFSRTPSGQLVRMESNGYTISWGLQVVGNLPFPGITDDQNHLTNDESMHEQSYMKRYVPDESVSARVREMDYSFLDAEERKFVAEKSTSQLSYEKVFGEEIDVNYFVLPTRIKEEIILNAPQNITAYVMTVATDLDARLLDNRQIEFYHEDEVIFTMWAPYMYDTVGELSKNIAVDLKRSESGTYIITMSLDSEWLNNPERTYPIVIDPDVTVSLAKTNGLDNYVWEGQPTVVQDYNKDRMYVGRYRLDSSSPRYTARTYQKYDVMPTIPSGSTITAATQTFKLTSGTSTGAYASAYRVTGADWSSKTITWNNKPAAATSIAITGNNISQNGNFSELKLNMLNTVNAWYSGSTIGKNNNYGIMLRYQTETISDYNAFYSADVATESSRPRLVITYSTMEYPVLVKNARIYYDSSCTKSVLQLNGYFNDAKAAIKNTFNIDFKLQEVNSGSLLTGSSCPKTICNEDCGALNKCSTLHHKSSLRLVDIYKSASYYTYRLVGHRVCYYYSDTAKHAEVVGCGYRPGKDSITSLTSSTNIPRSIQHELTHNLGASHKTCTEGQDCVLKGDKDKWCDTCKANINQNNR